MFRRAGGQGYQPEDRAIYSSFRLPRKKREELATMSSEGPATVMFERDLDAERDAELFNERLLDQMLGLSVEPPTRLISETGAGGAVKLIKPNG